MLPEKDSSSHLPRLPERDSHAHKGDFGRVLVIGGSIGMAGAPALAGMAALRAGAGLVTVAVPACAQPTVAGFHPCLMTVPLPQTPSGQLEPAGTARILGARTAPDVLVIGPGAGQGPPDYARAFWDMIASLRGQAPMPAVVDADALNLAAVAERDAPDSVTRRNLAEMVFTPHPGELARLLGCKAEDVQQDREAFARKTAAVLNRGCPADKPAVVVLKGAGTTVTDGRRLYRNTSGNPGMATAGSGDVLAGVIAALIGQGLSCFQAAVLGVHLHGRAGDHAAARFGQVAMTATDLIEMLPAAFLEHAAAG